MLQIRFDLCMEHIVEDFSPIPSSSRHAEPTPSLTQPPSIFTEPAAVVLYSPVPLNVKGKAKLHKHGFVCNTLLRKAFEYLWAKRVYFNIK